MRFAIKLAVAMSILGPGAALAAESLPLPLLQKLSRGQWMITPNDGTPARRICLGDPLQLVKLRHVASANCDLLDTESAPDRLVVHFTCRGAGYGRTTIRRETETLLQIESEGVAAGQPFQFRAEARRTGACR